MEPTASSCTPAVAGRPPTGEPPTRRRASDTERTVLGDTNLARACNLWLNLAGHAWDFDDLQQELAVRLGWVDDPGLNLAEFLDATATVIEAASWELVRRHAVEAFFDLASDACTPCGELDMRSFDEVCDDTQFDVDGHCRLCELDPDPSADRGLHRDVAAALACGRLSWDQVYDACATH